MKTAVKNTAAKYREPKWNSSLNRWMLRIGKKLNKAGQPVEASFYWSADYNAGNCPSDVFAEAVLKQKQFDAIRQDWSNLRPRLEAVYVGRVEQRPNYSEPVWIDLKELEENERGAKVGAARGEAILQEQHQNDFVRSAQQKPESHADLIAKLISAGVIPASFIPARPTKLVTIREAIEAYLEHERARTSLKMGK
ncbi:MAG TPA: hypothetical protein VF669_03945, partial [Tepidisphaeraceae bacterium]